MAIDLSHILCFNVLGQHLLMDLLLIPPNTRPPAKPRRPSAALERLARLRGERKAINETRPSAAILAAVAGARHSEQPALREALAMARRRDALDLELATSEKRLIEIPQIATADPSAAVLSEIGGTAISEVELRRFRLALLLGLPLCGGLVLSLAFALATASARRMATAYCRTVASWQQSSRFRSCRARLPGLRSQTRSKIPCWKMAIAVRVSAHRR
jgi:hypothetical protein